MSTKPHFIYIPEIDKIEEATFILSTVGRMLYFYYFDTNLERNLDYIVLGEV